MFGLDYAVAIAWVMFGTPQFKPPDPPKPRHHTPGQAESLMALVERRRAHKAERNGQDVPGSNGKHDPWPKEPIEVTHTRLLLESEWVILAIAIGLAAVVGGGMMCV